MLKARLAGDPMLAGLQLSLLADPGKRVRTAHVRLMDESLVSENDAMLFVLDLCAAPYTAAIGAELDDLSLHNEALKWLQFIGMQCPERGISEWPMGS